MISWLTKRAQLFEKLSEYGLVKKIQKGDQDAFGKLYLRYLDRMYRYIFFRVGQQQETAEDLTETVFVKAWQNIEGFKASSGNFRAWLYRIAHNTVIDYYKTQKAHSQLTEAIASNETMSVVEEKIDQEQMMESIEGAMEVLSDEQKSVITLRFIEGLSNEEIAVILDKQEDAVRALQYRGLQALRKVLKHE